MILVATDSVHTSAAAADYLEQRPADRVVVLTVGGARGGQEALNAARVRLDASPATVETVTIEPVDESAVARTIDDVARERDPAAIVVGHGGDVDEFGSTVRSLLSMANRPVVVVPIDRGG